jgi:hypothetical protein
LDENAAYDAATLYLVEEDDIEYSVIVGSDRVNVSVSRQATTGFLRVLGIDSVDIDASSTAEPRHGIESAGP